MQHTLIRVLIVELMILPDVERNAAVRLRHLLGVRSRLGGSFLATSERQGPISATESRSYASRKPSARSSRLYVRFQACRGGADYRHGAVILDLPVLALIGGGDITRKVEA